MNSTVEKRNSNPESELRIQLRNCLLSELFYSFIKKKIKTKLKKTILLFSYHYLRFRLNSKILRYEEENTA
jgi:hypothetical protein